MDFPRVTSISSSTHTNAAPCHFLMRFYFQSETRPDPSFRRNVSSISGTHCTTAKAVLLLRAAGFHTCSPVALNNNNRRRNVRKPYPPEDGVTRLCNLRIRGGSSSWRVLPPHDGGQFHSQSAARCWKDELMEGEENVSTLRSLMHFTQEAGRSLGSVLRRDSIGRISSDPAALL
ncbi:unnamed protein product [Pleuronectes platessa]|uniref:Uncharacterized protein n=1 Tax=Pleuronectes platessa TaxID=8262 RepID=A0A9N7VF31_PLEPL|nr:unnamed protein product [Pleuronectes platessa]